MMIAMTLEDRCPNPRRFTANLPIVNGRGIAAGAGM
jgi:hypothetical protein